jgi:hypothetical protein
MKYKKQFATGALAFSLLISGTNVFAATPRDLGIKIVDQATQKEDKDNKSSKIKHKGKSKVVGITEVISPSGFILDVKNKKTQTTSSLDVETTTNTLYSKNGIAAKETDLLVGQKVIVIGSEDKTTNTMIAKKVKIVTS